MNDIAATREYCRQLGARLEGHPDWAALRAVFLDLAAVMSRLQGAVNESVRLHGETEDARQAQEALDRMKAGVRQVGLDIRLASAPALQMGLQSSLESAFETLDRLEQKEEPSDG